MFLQIKTVNLKKKFKKLTAVDSINLEIQEGEIFGVLGPNGAGKTTIISILSTLLKPTSGTVWVGGYDVQTNPEKVRRIIGVVFQETVLDNELTARDNLEFHAGIYGLNDKRKIGEFGALVGLENQLDKKVETFSGGMKRRLEIARGLLHNPKILFLDEPTLGLDPQVRRNIWSYLLNLRKQKGTTIVLTTHYMDEADALCDRIAIIDKGKIVVSGPSSELKRKLQGDVIRIEAKGLTRDILKKLKLKTEKGGAEEISIVTHKAEEKLFTILDVLKNAKVTIQQISVRKPTLEDVFLHYTGKEMKEDA